MSKRRATDDLSSADAAKRHEGIPPDRAILFSKRLRSLNRQFAEWVRQQAVDCIEQLWFDGVEDYQKYLQELLGEFKDIIPGDARDASPAPASRLFDTPHIGAAGAGSSKVAPRTGGSTGRKSVTFAATPGEFAPAAAAAGETPNFHTANAGHTPAPVGFGAGRFGAAATPGLDAADTPAPSFRLTPAMTPPGAADTAGVGGSTTTASFVGTPVGGLAAARTSNSAADAAATPAATPPSSTTGGGFMFGAVSSTPAAAAAGAIGAAASTSTAGAGNSSAAGFSFGVTPAASSSSGAGAASSSGPAFTFGAAAAGGSEAGGAASSSAAPAFSFGAAAAGSSTAAGGSSSAPAFSFGAAGGGGSTGPAAFGTPQVTAGGGGSGFSFGGGSTAAAGGGGGGSFFKFPTAAGNGDTAGGAAAGGDGDAGGDADADPGGEPDEATQVQVDEAKWRILFDNKAKLYIKAKDTYNDKGLGQLYVRQSLQGPSAGKTYIMFTTTGGKQLVAHALQPNTVAHRVPGRNNSCHISLTTLQYELPAAAGGKDAEAAAGTPQRVNYKLEVCMLKVSKPEVLEDFIKVVDQNKPK